MQEGGEPAGHVAAGLRKAFGVAGGGKDLVGDVEAVDRQWPPAVEDDRGGVRIGKDVELGGGGHVSPGPRGAAHHHDLADLRHQLGVPEEQQGEIGERPDRDEGHLPVSARPQGVGHEGDCPMGLDRAGRHLHLDAFEPALAVVAHRGHRLAHQRPPGACVDRGVRESAKPAKEAGIAIRDLERHVPGYRGDAGELNLRRRCERHRDGERIVAAGVAVEDDAAAARVRAHARFLSVSCPMGGSEWRAPAP